MTLRLIPDIHRATHRIGLHLERVVQPGVTQAEAHILAHLGSAGESTIAELHHALAHKRSTLTNVLDRLERRGLATRELDAEDRRTFRIRLTPTGHALAAEVLRSLEAMEARALARLGRAKLEALKAVLQDMG